MQTISREDYNKKEECMKKFAISIAECKVTVEIPTGLYDQVVAIGFKKKKSPEEIFEFALLKYGNPVAALHQYIKYNSK
jgi:hypothetical protein